VTRDGADSIRVGLDQCMQHSLWLSRVKVDECNGEGMLLTSNHTIAASFLSKCSPFSLQGSIPSFFTSCALFS